VQQRDFILRMIERLGQMLIAIRNRILRGEDPQQIEDELRAGSAEAGLDLDLVRSFTLDSLLMLVGNDGEIQPDRAWLMAEILLLDGIQATRLRRPELARQSLLKARALFDSLGPQGTMLVGIPDVRERIAEVDELLGELPPEQVIE
jgi:hypothetical protein